MPDNPVALHCRGCGLAFTIHPRESRYRVRDGTTFVVAHCARCSAEIEIGQASGWELIQGEWCLVVTRPGEDVP